MYKVQVNNSQNFEFQINRNEIQVGGETVVFDQISTGEHGFHLLYQNKSYRAEILELNKEEKTGLISVNGNNYTIKISDQFDALLQQLGMDNLLATKVSELKAPMPGLVLK